MQMKNANNVRKILADKASLLTASNSIRNRDKDCPLLAAALARPKSLCSLDDLELGSGQSAKHNGLIKDLSIRRKVGTFGCHDRAFVAGMLSSPIDCPEFG